MLDQRPRWSDRVVKPVALTLGEPAGIGPDIAITAWLRRKSDAVPAFYLLGDRAFIAVRAKLLGVDGVSYHRLPPPATQQPRIPVIPMKIARRRRSAPSGKPSTTLSLDALPR